MPPTTYSFDATTVTLNNKTRTFRNSVSFSNRFDFYQVKVGKKSSRLDVALSGLNSDADLLLFNSVGKLLKRSTRSGNQPEKLSAQATGTYYIAVVNNQEQTNYRLKLGTKVEKKNSRKPIGTIPQKLTFNIPGFNSFTISSQEYSINWNGSFDYEDFDNDPFFSDDPIKPGGTGGVTNSIDLAGDGFSVFPSQFSSLSGRSFSVDFEIKNSGNINSGAFQVDFYLSADNQFGGSDYLLGTYDVPGVVTGETVELQKGLSLPPATDPWWVANPASNASGGFFQTYYVGMVVDATNAVIETNESNNSGTGDFFGDYEEISLL